MKTKLTVFLVSMIVLAIAVLVVAQTQLEMETELGLLEGELVDANYSWLVNYSVGYPSVDVMVAGGEDVIVSFENVSGEGWYKVYLTNLSGVEDVFDLRSVGGVWFDYVVDPTCPAGMSGSGIEGDACVVTNCTDLQAMNSGLSYWYELGNDVNCSDTVNWNSGAGFVPIGTFTGMFDGKNHTISGLYINRGATNYVGLFGYVNNTSTVIQNVGLVGADISGSAAVGGLIGQIVNTLTIDNCYVTGDVEGASQIGGLIGTNNKASVVNSHFIGSVYGSGAWVGGLVGYDNINAKTYENCYAAGNVSGDTIVGGFIGYLLSSGATSINNSYATGDVYGTSYIGGFIGSNERANISNCYATGNVISASGTDVGGLVGRDSTTAKAYVNCYATGNVSGATIGGGLIGYLFSTGATYVNNSYATGSINMSGNYVGGLIGVNDKAAISNSYATGNAITSGTNVGGLVGLDRSGKTHANCYAVGNVSGSGTLGGLIGSGGTCTNSFWDNQTSGQSSSACGATGKTTAAMKSLSTYTNTSTVGLTTAWDFVGTPNDDVGVLDIWEIDGSINNGYPYFVDVTPPVVILNAPADNYNSSESEVLEFNCSASDNYDLENVSLYLNGIFNGANGSNGNLSNIDFATEGDYIQENSTYTNISGGIGKIESVATGYTPPAGTYNIADTTSTPGYTILKWTSTGTTSWTPAYPMNVELLVVAGGGAGGGYYMNGGGGAGELVYRASSSVGSDAVSLAVGAGGVGQVNNFGLNGGNSSFGSLTAKGGGGGGAPYDNDGRPGGSGGGGTYNIQVGGASTAVDGVGYAGGSSNGRGGGGGGGAGGVGGNDSGSNGGAGGSGLFYFGSWYAGGGGGSANDNAVGGVGQHGGGNGGVWSAGAVGTAGTANTGGGGGGHKGGVAGHSGGSGIVIIKYLNPYYATPSYITTSDISQKNTSAWLKISGITLTQTTPNNTDIKYLVSFDDRATWKYWNGSAWISSSLNDLQTNGMSKATLEGLSSASLSSTGGFVPGTLDFAMDFSTDGSATPELDNIEIRYIDSVNYIFNRSLSRGSYEWNCLACDSSSNCAFSSTNRTVNILGMNISQVLSPNPVSVGGTVYVSGHVNLTNGANVSNNPVNVYLNGSLVNGTESSDSFGDYNISFVSPSTNGTYSVVVNSTYSGIVGFSSLNLVVADLTAPVVTLNSPINNSEQSNFNFNFNCSVSDDYYISNVSLYENWSGGWHSNETNSSGLNGVNYIFNKTLPVGSYTWNCYACDGFGNCGFAADNYSFDNADYNMTYLNNGTISAYGWLGGVAENVSYNTSISGLVLSSGKTAGSFTSQIFDGGSVVVWSNISWNGYTLQGNSSDKCNGGTAMASSDYGGGYPASNAFDNLWATNVQTWLADSGQVTNQYIGYDFGSGNDKIIRSYTIRGSYVDNAHPSSWTFQGSNNSFATWDVLHTVTGESGWSTYSFHNYSFSNSQAYRYYRIYITQNQGSGTYLGVSEVEMMEFSGNLSLNFSIRSCDDNICSGESWVDLTNDSSSQNLSLTGNRYLQYLVNFTTTNNYDSPKLYNVSVGVDIFIPTITLNSPADNSNQSASEFNFNCSVSDNHDISNVSLYGNWSGGWHSNETNSSGLNGVNYIFNKTLPVGSYTWNCYACDSSSNCAFSSTNRTVNILGMNISQVLSPNPVSVGGTVYVSGHVNLTNGTNVSNNPVNVYLNGSLVNGTESSDSFGDYNISFVSPSTNGTYSVVVNSTYSGIVGFSSLNLVVSDLTNPVVTLNSPVDEYNVSDSESVSFNCTVSDEVGVANVSLVLNGVLNESNSSGVQGDYVFSKSFDLGVSEWSCLGCDSSGNCGFSSSNRSVNILGMNVSESLNPNPVDFGELVYVSGKLNLTDGVNVSSNSVSVYLNGSLANGSEVTDASGNYNVSFVAPSVIGSYVVVVNSTYGSWSASNSLDLVVRDSGSPVVVLNSPVDEYNMSILAFDFNCSASDNYEIANVSLYLDGVLNETNSSGLNGSDYVFSKSFDLGSYEWSCLACDSSSNCGFSSANRTVNVLGMNISESLNPNPVDFGELVYVSGKLNLTDGVNVSSNSIGVYLNGSLANGSEVTDASGNYNVSFVAPSVIGSYVVVVNSTYGSWSASNSLDLVVRDSGSPVVVLNSPVDEYNMSAGSLDFNCTASDNYEIANVSLYLNGVLNGTNSSGLNASDYVFNRTLDLGSYEWSCLACDSSGDCSFSSANRSLRVLELVIGINTESEANTTNTINVNGFIREFNGSDYWNVANNLFVMKLNNVTVSSDTLNHTNFSGGVLTDIDTTSNARLNLSSVSSVTSYSDDFSTTGYLTDAYSYSNEAYSSGTLFELDNYGASNVGNVTYKFTSVTGFYNATAYVVTDATPSDAGGNTSVWYSLNGSSFSLVDSSVSSGATIGGVVPVDEALEFYVMIQSDVSGSFDKENPVTSLEINYTSYEYPSIGNVVSPTINLADVTYTVLKWDESLESGTDVLVQLRESDNGTDWDAWGSNYTSGLDNDITGLSKNYLQYRAWLSTTNGSVSPTLYDVQILYFNASTNSTGGYDYNITIPTTNLGVLPLSVEVVQNDATGILGSNSSDIEVWAVVELPYSESKNYSGSETNYSVAVNFTRVDNGALGVGNVDVTIWNSSFSDVKSCLGVSECEVSWGVPSEVATGNYSVNVSSNNESGYYRNATNNFTVYLEEKDTTGSVYAANKTVGDYSYGSVYHFDMNVSVTNTGEATMSDIAVYDYVAARGSAILNVSTVSACPDLLPGESGNATMSVYLKDVATSGSYLISWRANWTDNDATVSDYVSYTEMRVIIVGEATMLLSSYAEALTIQHNNSNNFSFYINSTGSDSVTSVDLTFVEGALLGGDLNLSSSWVSILTSNPIGLIPAGSASLATVQVTVPVQAAPGNYSGKLNLTAVAGGSLVLNMTLTVPLNGTWYLTPSANFTYNNSYPIGIAGEIGNYTLVNLGNVNMTFDVSYSPSGSTDYSAFGTALFEEDYNVSGVNTNPSNVSVAKGENTSITLYQKGDSSQRTDVGIIASFNNSNATPVSFAVEDAWSIEGQPPAISGVWFLLDGEYGSIAEQNKNMSIKFRATDDVALNVSGAVINITWGGGATQISAIANTTFGEYTLSGADYVVLNYSGVYAPTTAGAYVVSAMVLDESGQSYSSGEYNFTSYGTTEVSLSQNYSSINVSNVDLNNKGFVYVNYTINNSELVTAYSPTLTFAKNSSIVISNYTFGNLSAGEVASHVIQMNVSELTAAGNYNVTATLTWTNPNTGTDSDSVVFAITVEENKSFVYSPASVIMNTASGSSNSSILTINNTGNVILNSVNLSCYSGDLCSSMSVLFNESAFSIGTNSSKAVNVSLSVPAGLAAGAYSGVLNISGVGVSQTLNIYSTVPTSKTWTLSTNSINTTKGNSVSADLQEVVINNTGNVNMTWNLVSSNTSLFGLNESSLMVPLGTSKSFMINYTSPDTEGNYVGTISVTNTDGAAVPVQENITINMTVTAVDVTIVSPSSSVPLTGVEAGDVVNVVANASYGSVNITNESVWSVSIGGVSCVNSSYEYNESDNEWDISCVAPSLSDGVTYNITVVLNHTTYGEITSTNLNSVSYLDVTKPNFVFTRNHVTLGNNINVQVNVSDNVGVDSVWGVLFYPNSSNVSFDLTSSGGYYINNSFALNTAGEYLVNVSANDSTGNVNYSSDWFEVYDNYAWILNLTNYAGSGVNGTNVSLYRPNTSTLLLSNTTGVDGGLTLSTNERFYDMFVNFSGDSVLIRNVNFTNWTTSNISFNGYRIAGEDVDEIVTLYRPFIGIAANASGLSENSAELSFSYDGYGYEVGTALEIIKCADWNYSGRSCGGSWAGLTSVRDTDAKRITANSSGFSVYFLAENKCGNGACETTYGETTVTCSADCTAAVDVPASSGGGGGGGGGSSTSTVDLDKLLQSILDIGGVIVETTSIYKEVFPGDVSTVRIKLKNTLDSELEIKFSSSGDVESFLFFEAGSIKLAAGESRDVVIKIIVPEFAKIGEYNGELIILSGEDKGVISTTIVVLSPEGKLLDVKIQPLTPTVVPGNVLRLQVDLLNLGKTKVVDVQFDLQLIDLETGEIVTRAEEAFAVETTISVVKNLTIPDWVKPARYMVKAVAYYSNIELEGTMQASSIAYVDVQYEFFDRKIFGIYLWAYLLFFLLVALGIGGYYYLKWLDYRNKRFKTKLDVSKLPRTGKDAAFLGKVAETGIRAFGDLNKMQMHTLIAGSTGSGKTVAAQDIIEEALIHKKSVIVFDPTAQWTGFLRKCEESKMLKRYKYFDMKEKEARSFEGSIKTISDPYEIIDIKKHMSKPGEIMIFDISKLTPKEMDIVVASTIEQIFRSVPEEKSELDTLIVYDEVHRLLPKFGGSGAGFVQIERGAREFRKWGIGLVLISQVLSDFVGEIKANIGTEIQMGTRYEGDLERVSMKYGDDILKSVAKEPIGTGMNVNAEYNNGIPYFISFRPLLHSSKRLTKTELTKYAKYFDEIEDLDYQIEELKKLDVDTLDADLELKLAKSKVKLGKFQMADVYMESVRPKILEYWKQVGKEPVHMVKRRLKKDVVMTGIQKAKEERANYIKKNPQEIVSIKEELLELKKEIEGKKKEGIDTSKIEIEFHVLEDRVKPFKGKVPAGDADVLRLDVERIRAELDGLKVPENKKE